MTHLSAIVACHNRRDLTVQALRSLRDACTMADVALDVVLYDDGSTDGTSDAVRALDGLTIHVIAGDGSAYWANSMASAEAFVMNRDVLAADAILWLNDDVRIDEDAIVRLIELTQSHASAILVGSVRDPDSEQPTYSGYRRRGAHPLRLTIISPTEVPVPLDAFHGNLVWVPIEVAKALGGIDGGYAHGMADIDYGFRATDDGIRIMLAPHSFGTCSSNLPAYSGTLMEQWKMFVSRKGGGNFVSMKRILQKRSHIWWYFAGYSYTAWWVKAAARKFRELRNGAARHV